MLKKIISCCCLAACVLTAGMVEAALITGVSVSATVDGSNTYTHSPSLLINGVIPAPGTRWYWTTNVYWNGGLNSTMFTIDYGGRYSISDVLVSVDNNDGYRVDYSLDNVNWSSLLQILPSYGNYGPGMDTMSTDATNPEYVSQIDFTDPVTARYLRIFATEGDNSYAVGEVQAFGSSAPEEAPVPEPSTFVLFAAGVVWVVLKSKRMPKLT